ncbi:MAG: hypothetical protein RLP09_46105 [Sandaracinaceae bacterium]
MTCSTFLKRSSRTILVVALLGCGSKPTQTSGQAAREPVPGPEAAEATHEDEEDGELGAPVAATGPVVDDPRFELRAEATGPLHAGSAGTLRVQLEPRGEYEVEARYPYRLVFHPPDGLAVDREELARRDAAEITAERAAFEVGVTPARAGMFECTVDVEFAVCSENGCVPLERTLTVPLSAS